MDTFLSILLVLACFLIVAAVLLQPSKGGGLTPLGGSSQSIFGSTGGTTFLFRLTMWTAAFIMVVSLFLARRKVQEGKSSVIDTTLATPALPPNPSAQVPLSNSPAGTSAGGPTPQPLTQKPATPPTQSVAPGAPSAGTSSPTQTTAPTVPVAPTTPKTIPAPAAPTH